MLGDRRLKRGALGAVAEKLASQAVDPVRGERDRGHPEGRLLLGDQPRREQDQRIGRPW